MSRRVGWLAQQLDQVSFGKELTVRILGIGHAIRECHQCVTGFEASLHNLETGTGQHSNRRTAGLETLLDDPIRSDYRWRIVSAVYVQQMTALWIEQSN